MSENKVLTRMFGLARDEVTGGWIKLHTDVLHNLYSSPNIGMIKKDEVHKTCTKEDRDEKTYKILVGKSDGN
jgi:hypothetical protein